nr:MAG TPA: hypothetical protein [Caudoviricetes sp.]
MVKLSYVKTNYHQTLQRISLCILREVSFPQV